MLHYLRHVQLSQLVALNLELHRAQPSNFFHDRRSVT